MVAVILAGGRGSRLKSLTKSVAKPAVCFGGKYRIIDFALSNVANSDIEKVGVLTQYESSFLNRYIGTGANWGLNGIRSYASILTPKETPEGACWYLGTADAIYQNIDFLDKSNCKYVLILSGDHIYKMDYTKLLDFHKKHNAKASIVCIPVTIQEASRFGIMVCDKTQKIIEFQEKPAKPKSTLASAGIYLFNYDTLREELISDHKKKNSSHDFGKDIIPTLLSKKVSMFGYPFEGYWKDVGTINSLWQANMDLLDDEEKLDIKNNNLKILSRDTYSLPQKILKNGSVKNSLVNQGAIIDGVIEHSIISNEVIIKKNASIKNSYLMPKVVVNENVKIEYCVVQEGCHVTSNKIGTKDDILLVEAE